MLTGMLLSAKGDRATRHSATEGRYPFLDERVVDFCASLAPEYKLRGWTDKWLLRRVAARVLPPPARQPTARPCFAPTWARRSSARIGRAGWISCSVRNRCARPAISTRPRCNWPGEAQLRKARKSLYRFSLDMGLIGVISTQLWHHIYCGGGLADLPAWSPPDLVQTRLYGRIPSSSGADRYVNRWQLGCLKRIRLATLRRSDVVRNASAKRR